MHRPTEPEVREVIVMLDEMTTCALQNHDLYAEVTAGLAAALAWTLGERDSPFGEQLDKLRAVGEYVEMEMRIQ